LGINLTEIIPRRKKSSGPKIETELEVREM
jgi:hypothetical protein